MASEIKDLAALKHFKYERLLNEDPLTRSISLLGTFPHSEGSHETVPGIVRIEKAALPSEQADSLISTLLNEVHFMEANDVYSWFLGWFKGSRDVPEVKINVICPATETHIRKYTKQELLMVHETPAIYEKIVKPHIASFPPSRTQWVEDILSGKAEAEKVLYQDPSPDHGFIIISDMKWDMKTISALYLVAIVRPRDIKCLRDLRKRHLDMLRKIRREAARVVEEKWGLGRGSTRLFIHYHPSYYHFHVHIVNANLSGLMGMTVGQAHLLDDVISLLELDSNDEQPIFERMTLTYGIGDQYDLYDALMAAQVEEN